MNKASPVDLMEEETLQTYYFPSFTDTESETLNVYRNLAPGQRVNKWKSQDANSGLSDFSAYSLTRATCASQPTLTLPGGPPAPALLPTPHPLAWRPPPAQQPGRGSAPSSHSRLSRLRMRWQPDGGRRAPPAACPRRRRPADAECVEQAEQPWVPNSRKAAECAIPLQPPRGPGRR